MDRERLREGFLRFLPEDQVEWWTIQEQSDRMSSRANGKYDALLVTLNLLSNFNPLVRFVPFASPFGSGISPGLEVAYHCVRAVDDVADGDAPLPAGFSSIQEWFQSLHRHIDDGGINIPKGASIEYLLKRTLYRMGHYNSPTFSIQTELHSCLVAMKDENDRRMNQKVLSREELEQLYRGSFGSPHTIALVALGSRTRTHDIPELAQVQGRLFALADLKLDLTRGIINIPQEVLKTTPENFLETEGFAKWTQTEIDDCGRLISSLRERKLDWRGKAYVGYLLKGLDKFYKGEK